MSVFLILPGREIKTLAANREYFEGKDLQTILDCQFAPVQLLSENNTPQSDPTNTHGFIYNDEPARMYLADNLLCGSRKPGASVNEIAIEIRKTHFARFQRPNIEDNAVIQILGRALITTGEDIDYVDKLNAKLNNGR